MEAPELVEQRTTPEQPFTHTQVDVSVLCRRWGQSESQWFITFWLLWSDTCRRSSHFTASQRSSTVTVEDTSAHELIIVLCGSHCYSVVWQCFYMEQLKLVPNPHLWLFLFYVHCLCWTWLGSSRQKSRVASTSFSPVELNCVGRKGGFVYGYSGKCTLAHKTIIQFSVRSMQSVCVCW